MTIKPFQQLLRFLAATIAISPLLGVTLARPGWADTCTNASIYYDSRTGTRIRSDGTTLRKGKPFFPLGFHHISWYSTIPHLLSDLNEIAAAGFNTVHASAGDPDHYQVVLDRAQQLGLSLITEDGSPEMASRYGWHSAVMGWTLADDVDNGRFSVSQITDRHFAVVGNDRKSATFIAGFSKNLPSYVNSANIVGIMSYPIGLGGYEDEIVATYPQISILTHAVKSCNRAPYAILQSYNWGSAFPHILGLRAPTAPEARNMTYQAIVAGAKGILYFAHTEWNWNLPRQAPELWAGLKTLVPEINTLSPYLLNGRVTPINTGQPKVFAGWWRRSRQAILVVVNASYQTSPRASLTLPATPNSQQLLFSDRPLVEAKPIPNQLDVELSPLSVVVYQMQL